MSVPQGDSKHPSRYHETSRSPSLHDNSKKYEYNISNTIFVSGLPKHIKEYDIRQEVLSCGLAAKEIRRVRERATGTRDYAFIEFNMASEAAHLMKKKKGVFMFQGKFRAKLSYCRGKQKIRKLQEPPDVWFCRKCSQRNYRSRETCYRCNASIMESQAEDNGNDEICSFVTKTIMLRNLHAWTTENSVMSVLNHVIPDLIKTICAVGIRVFNFTSTSRGICYLGADSTVDALALYNALNKLPTLIIDNTPVNISFCKYSMGDVKQPYTPADNATFSNAEIFNTSALRAFDYLTQHCTIPAKSQLEFLRNHQNNFMRHFVTGNLNTWNEFNQTNEANAAAFYGNSIGYQYDPSTGLYYHPNSRYYWNGNIKKFVYWDQEKLAWVLADNIFETN